MTTIDPQSRVFAERLQLHRKRKGWTQAELAERIDAGQNTISKWEKGLSSPSIPKLLQLCEVFGVASDYLIGRCEHETGLPIGMYLVDQDVIDDPVELDEMAVKIPARPRLMSSDEMLAVYRESARRMRKGKR
jgi:transcriptional regulator with XRE-family HTH domain